MEQGDKMYIAGHQGLVGSAITRRLQAEGYRQLVTRSHRELDLCDRTATLAFFERERPAYVFLAAARVGGISANNSYPADFIRDNLLIESNVMEAAFRSGVRKLLFLGSSCIYPKLAEQPIKEDYLLTGPLEPTNDAYAIAKIAGILMCRSYNRQHGTDFIAAMPTNLYGPHDNFDLQTSHVLPAMIRSFHEAKLSGRTQVERWGTGTPRREFLHVDDLADALLFLMHNFTAPRDAAPHELFVNVGVGEDITIAELAQLVARIVGYTGAIVWNKDMPDGTPRKVLDVSRLSRLGWRARTSLTDGITQTYRWFTEQQ
jgi:GDP-L-fucose synthase